MKSQPKRKLLAATLGAVTRALPRVAFYRLDAPRM